MRFEVEYGDLANVDRLLGVKVVTSPKAPRPGAMVDLMEGVLYVHPDEEHMVWASLGFIDEAFYKLNRSLERRIQLAAKKSVHNLYLIEVGELAMHHVTV